MKIIAIVGSIRRGNTYSMVEAGCHAITECDVELIHLKEVKIDMCEGCLRCDEKGECYKNDDMKDIIARMKEADGFIFGTPCRWSLLSGEMKVFIDRLNPLAKAELLKNKKAIIFSVGQSKGKDKKTIKRAIDSVRFFCENANIEIIDSVFAMDCLDKNDLITGHPEILNECRKAAGKLYFSLINE